MKIQSILGMAVLLALACMPVLAQVTTAPQPPGGAAAAAGDFVPFLLGWAKFLLPVIGWLIIAAGFIFFFTTTLGKWNAASEKGGSMGPVGTNIILGLVILALMIFAQLYMQAFVITL